MKNLINTKTLVLSTMLLLSSSNVIMANDFDDEKQSRPTLTQRAFVCANYAYQYLPTEEMFDEFKRQVPEVKPVIKAIKTIYALSQSGDDVRNQNTVARAVGHKVEGMIDQLPGGRSLNQALKAVTPTGFDTCAENVLNKLAPMVGRVKIEEKDSNTDIAKKVVASVPFVGNALVNSASRLSGWWYGS